MRPIETTASELLDRFGRCLRTVNECVSNAITQDNQVAFVEGGMGRPSIRNQAPPRRIIWKTSTEPKAPAAADHTLQGSNQEPIIG
ncbi:hypothetical protein A6U98_20220 [Rhizobium sp. WYCCWR10014]|nr:hypothetical protein A6U98_20220 [Rhizobium sp. WYCCWR10014]